MSISLVGAHPDDLASQSPHATRPATFFLDHRVLVTDGLTHAMQWARFAEWLQEKRRQAGEPELSEEELASRMGRSAVLYTRNGCLELPLARNDRDLLLEADRLLQADFPKHRIRFLGVSDPEFIEAIRRRGELWRITPPPTSREAITKFIEQRRNALGGEAIYYHNPHTGTRHLTYDSFASLERMDDERLARHLQEIADHLGRMTRQGTPELVLWPGSAHQAVAARLRQTDWSGLRGEALHRAYAELRRDFEAATPPDLRRDDPRNQIWRDSLFDALGREQEARTTLFADEVLGPLFRHQVRWLPGLHFERDECVLDSVLSQAAEKELGDLYNPTAIEVMRNTAREFVDLEFLNIGEIPNRLRPGPIRGRRQVFLLDFKRRSEKKSRLLVARFQKYGIREHLEEGESLVNSILAAQDYTEYILNRRLGCRQLGMPLPEEFVMQQIPERAPRKVHGLGKRLIWATYFTRDFIPGTPTPDLGEECLADSNRSLAIARLMGEAAAINLVVGRVVENGSTEVNFDYGNEIIQFDESGQPVRLVFSHHEGAFGNFQTPLTELAEGYARPVNLRADRVPDPVRFAEEYLAAFQQRYTAIQKEYLEHRDAFDRLFRSLIRDPNGSFGSRWDACLDRLEHTSPEEVTRAVRKRIGCLPAADHGPATHGQR